MPRWLRRFIYEASCARLVARDFATSDLAVRLCDAGWELGADRDFWHTPPVDVLFLDRKVGGLYLLAPKLKARVAKCFKATEDEIYIHVSVEVQTSAAGGKRSAQA